jgi:hypothetical protein
VGESCLQQLAALAVDVECWPAICGMVRLGPPDVARLRALGTSPLATVLRDAERAVIEAVATHDWRREPPATLLGMPFVAHLLVHVCETGVMPDTNRQERFDALLVRLVCLSAAAGRAPLALARLALLALHSFPEVQRELEVRLRELRRDAGASRRARNSPRGAG